MGDERTSAGTGGAADAVGLNAAFPGIRDEQTADVLGALSPTARRILEAAYRVLERDGYHGLSLRRIAQEADETRSLILYHFENKAGLVATLVDSLWHDADVALETEVEGLSADPRGRVLALTGLHHRLAQQPRLYRIYFALLPHVLADRDARARLTRTYRSYRHIGELCLAPAAGAQAALPLSILLLSIGEGIAVQTLLAESEERLARAFAVLERRVLLHLGLEPCEVLAGAGVSSVRGSIDASRAAGDSSMGTLHDMEDPAAGLAPAAAQVLEAAWNLLSEGGPQAITAEALAAASGQPSSSVFYHFGDKRGLESVLVASADYRFAQALLKAAQSAAKAPRSAELVADVTARIFAQPGWMRTFFAALPALLRDEELCSQEAAFVDRMLLTLAAFLREGGIADREAWPLASLSLALTHGLAIQRLVDRQATPVDAVLGVWRALLHEAKLDAAEPSSNA